MGLSVSVVESHLLGAGYERSDVAAFRRRWELCPDVWREFEKLTLRLITENKRAGAVDILARVRWERQIEHSEEFKCNNNDAPLLARIFVLKYPQHKTFFEFRAVGRGGEK